MRLEYVLLVSHYLQREEREVNHHVRRRTLGGKDEKGEYEKCVIFMTSGLEAQGRCS